MAGSLIYVAGNPNLYPLEYYNKDSDSYEGIIPQLLHDFSLNSEYEIVYYQPGEEDLRQQLAANKQVDILSGCLLSEPPPDNDGYVSILNTLQGEEEYNYALYFTTAAPDAFKEELQNYFANLSQEELNGLVLQSSINAADNNSSFWLAGSLLLVIILLSAILAFLLKHYRRKVNLAQQQKEVDAVTGLGNMDYLFRYYKQYINDKNRILYKAIYFYTDTERLRRLSDSQETDEFLRYCAVILQENTADSDILARVSDHGFMLLKMVTNEKEIDSWLSNILLKAETYAQIFDKPFETKMYAGIYALNLQDWDLNEIVFNASQGAYEANHTNKGYIVCSAEMMQKIAEEKMLQASIERALNRKEFQLYIQFYIDTQTFQIVGGEALSRWNHPQKGVLMPSSFVPLMEREKMISQLDYYCLNEACLFLEALKKEKIENFFISCNFSRKTFASAEMIAKVKEIISAYTFPRELLIFEITESVAVSNATQIRKNIIALKDLGVRVALDDFGEGFTSFYDLQKYPVDGIKLDKALIDYSLTENGKSILKAMIQVGHELGMTILAEGVEKDEQVQILQKINCDVIQGFRFYYPLPQWDAKKEIMKQFMTST